MIGRAKGAPWWGDGGGIGMHPLALAEIHFRCLIVEIEQLALDDTDRSTRQSWRSGNVSLTYTRRLCTVEQREAVISL